MGDVSRMVRLLVGGWPIHISYQRSCALGGGGARVTLWLYNTYRLRRNGSRIELFLYIFSAFVRSNLVIEDPPGTPYAAFPDFR